MKPSRRRVTIHQGAVRIDGFYVGAVGGGRWRSGDGAIADSAGYWLRLSNGVALYHFGGSDTQPACGRICYMSDLRKTIEREADLILAELAKGG